MPEVINNRQRRAHDKSVATMRAAVLSLEQFPGKLPRAALALMVGDDHVGATGVWTARAIAKQRPDLVNLVLDGKMSIYVANEVMRKGERIVCPTCKGRGHIHK